MSKRWKGVESPSAYVEYNASILLGSWVLSDRPPMALTIFVTYERGGISRRLTFLPIFSHLPMLI